MSDPFLSNLIPDSNRLDISFARHSSNNGVNLLAEAYSKGFVGACKDDPDWPEWARRAARYGLDDFMHNTPGTKKLFSDVESGLPSGDGDRAITCRHAIELWEAGGRTGVKPYSCYQGYGSCVDASASEHMTTLFGWRAAQAHLREQYIHPAAWYWYADRGYCSDGWYGSAIAAVALRRGCAFRTKYDLGGNTVDFTDDDLNERIVARTWCKSGIPSWLSDHTSANHPFEDGAITQLDGGLDALKKALAANGAVHCGGTRTSGGSKPFTPGRTGPHMQSAVGYDDSDEYRQWLKDNHSITLPTNDFAVIMHQTWGANWGGETGDAYWPTHLWGPKPEGAWVCKASYILGDAEYVWFPRVKGFPSSGPTPVPPAPPLVGKLRAEQAGQVIAIRGEVSIGGSIYIAVPNGDGTYGFIQKPVV